MTKQDFTNFITAQSPEDLKSFLISLYDSNEMFRNAMSSAISPDDAEAIFDKYEKRLDNCFVNIESFFGDAAKSILSEYTAMTTNQPAIADMNLAFAEDAVWLTNEFGDFEDEYYDAIVEAGLKAIDYCGKESGYLEDKEDRIEKLIHDCGAFGFGVADELKVAYEKVIGSDLE